MLETPLHSYMSGLPCHDRQGWQLFRWFLPIQQQYSNDGRRGDVVSDTYSGRWSIPVLSSDKTDFLACARLDHTPKGCIAVDRSEQTRRYETMRVVPFAVIDAFISRVTPYDVTTNSSLYNIYIPKKKYKNDVSVDYIIDNNPVTTDSSLN